MEIKKGGNRIMEIVLYSTNCPKCNVMAKMLQDRSIDFKLETDLDIVTKISEESGIMSAPMLGVDGKIMEFSQALKWIREHYDV